MHSTRSPSNTIASERRKESESRRLQTNNNDAPPRLTPTTLDSDSNNNNTNNFNSSTLDRADRWKSIQVTSHPGEMIALHPNFKPGPLDVLCARGKAALEHPGNRRFRSFIMSHLEEYEQAQSKLDKSLIVSSIIGSIRQASPDGGFVKQIEGVWYEVGDHNAREKCGQCLRDLLHTKYRSSTKAKSVRKRSTSTTGSNISEPNLNLNGSTISTANDIVQSTGFCYDDPSELNDDIRSYSSDTKEVVVSDPIICQATMMKPSNSIRSNQCYIAKAIEELDDIIPNQVLSSTCIRSSPEEDVQIDTGSSNFNRRRYNFQSNSLLNANSTGAGLPKRSFSETMNNGNSDLNPTCFNVDGGVFMGNKNNNNNNYNYTTGYASRQKRHVSDSCINLQTTGTNTVDGMNPIASFDYCQSGGYVFNTSSDILSHEFSSTNQSCEKDLDCKLTVNRYSTDSNQNPRTISNNERIYPNDARWNLREEWHNPSLNNLQHNYNNNYYNDNDNHTHYHQQNQNQSGQSSIFQPSTGINVGWNTIPSSTSSLLPSLSVSMPRSHHQSSLNNNYSTTDDGANLYQFGCTSNLNSQQPSAGTTRAATATTDAGTNTTSNTIRCNASERQIFNTNYNQHGNLNLGWSAGVGIKTESQLWSAPINQNLYIEPTYNMVSNQSYSHANNININNNNNNNINNINNNNNNNNNVGNALVVTNNESNDHFIQPQLMSTASQILFSDTGTISNLDEELIDFFL